jgi:hypothetical protein
MKSLQAGCCFLLVLMSCKQEIPDNCEGEYLFKRPYTTNLPQGNLSVGDSIIIKVSLYLNDYNYRSDSIVNINRFKKILCGFEVKELVKDTTNPVGCKDVGAKNEFSDSSPNVVLDLTEGIEGKNRVRYYLQKGNDSFFCTIKLVPKRKGAFYIHLLDGVIEDAFCNAGINAYWGNYSSINLVAIFQSVSGVIYDQTTIERLLKNRQSYCFVVN